MTGYELDKICERQTDCDYDCKRCAIFAKYMESRQAMKQRIPRKLKKGIRSLLYRRDTKWKRKARNIIQKEVKGFALSFFGNGVQLFEPGGIVSDKPVSNRGEYVVTKEEQQRLKETLRRGPVTVNVSINLDDMSAALKKKMLRDIQR